MQRARSARPLWGVMACALISALIVACTGAPGTDPATLNPSITTVVSRQTGSTVDAAPLEVARIPAGFGEAGLQIVANTAAGLTEAEMCVWEAVTPEQRSQGLMWVTDLGGRDGMVFVYDQDRSTSFTMRNTVLDLSIAFFDGTGAFMDAFDMEPCAGEPCPSYPTPRGFRLALEVPAGDLDRWGIGPGAKARLRAECDTP